jgi:uncharacterized protein YndB with AHSA1/START domain
MASVVNTILIAGPLEAVFDLVTQARFWPRWHPATGGVAGVLERPYQLGDVIHERGEVVGTPFSVTWTVIEHDRPARVVLDTPLPPAKIIYSFEERHAITEFQRELEYDEAAFKAKVPDPAALAKYMHTQSDEALKRLKGLVEKVLADEAAGF